LAEALSLLVTSMMCNCREGPPVSNGDEIFPLQKAQARFVSS